MQLSQLSSNLTILGDTGYSESVKNLFSYQFNQSNASTPNVPIRNNNTYGSDGSTATIQNLNFNKIQDFMTNITLNTRLWNHPLRANFSANQRVDLT